MSFIGYTYDEKKYLIITIEVLHNLLSNHYIEEENKLYAEYYYYTTHSKIIKSRITKPYILLSNKRNINKFYKLYHIF